MTTQERADYIEPKIAAALALLDSAVQQYKPKMVGLMSGGGDSIPACYVASLHPQKHGTIVNCAWPSMRRSERTPQNTSPNVELSDRRENNQRLPLLYQHPNCKRPRPSVEGPSPQNVGDMARLPAQQTQPEKP